jgi:hypothetical protein
MRHLVFLGLLTCAVLPAQDARGRITGQVSDPTGQPVAAAAVAATESSTGVRLSATSNSSGNYELPYLSPGVYELRVSAPGFKAYVRPGIEVRVGDIIRVDVPLALGEVGESVTVSSEVALVDSASANLGQVIDTRRLADLPLAAGNTLTVAEFAPGVTYLAQPNHPSLGIGAVEIVSNMTVSGTRPGNTEYTIDGAPSMSGTLPSYSPPTEMVAEVKVRTSTYDASLARVPGGNVNIVLRTGGNKLHGSVQWFHTNQNLEALTLFQRQFLYNPSTGPVTQAKMLSVNPLNILNRYGATLTGPVVLPKLYDGHNRTFWSFGFEGLSRPVETLGSAVSVPTLAERTGDFSALLKAGANYRIYDPATIAVAPGGSFSRQAFEGNLIPSSRLSPAALALLKYWPEPNQGGLADGSNNYVPLTSQANRQKNVVAKVDQNFSDRHRISARYNYGSQDFIANPIVGTETNVPNRWRHSHGAGIDDIYVFTPTLLNDIRLGFTRYDQSNTPQLAGFDLTSLGLPAALNNAIDPRARQFPALNINGYQALGGAANNDALTNYYNLADDLTWSRGPVIFRVGVEYRVLQANGFAIGGQNPTLNFASTYTNGPLDNSPASPIGQGLASFVLGIPSGGSISYADSFADQSYNYALYLQSDWRVNRRLTVNMGLRYDYDGPITERYNRSVGAFDFTNANPLASQFLTNYAKNPITQVAVAQFNVNGGLTFAGAGGRPRELFRTSHLNFAPRVGLAYQLTPNTVVRSGYGIFFVPTGVDRNAVNQAGYTSATALTTSTDNGLHFTSNLANPFPNGFNLPLGSAGGLSTGLGQAVSAFQPSMKSPYAQRWSAGLQRQFPRRIFIDLSYVGTRSTKLAVTRQYNAVPGSYYSTLGARDTATINLLTAAVANPFYPLLPGTSLSGTTVQRLQLLRPYPQFTGVSISEPDGYSWYHSLQTLVEKRFSQGLTAQFNWTWSKTMEATTFRNDFDPRPEKVISDLDRTHVFHLSGIYELPFGKGKPFLSRAHGITRQLAEGWQVQSTWQAFTGAALGFGNALLVAPLSSVPLNGSQTIAQWFNVSAFERASANQLANNVLTLSTRFSGIRGPGVDVWNMSAVKNFPINEKLRMQFRAEFLNALNHTSLGAPNTNPTSAAFGSITTANSQPRFIHFALKMTF